LKALASGGAKNVRPAEYSFEDGVRALKDKIIDALLVATFIIDPEKMMVGPNPAFSELLATAKVKFISYEEGTYDRARSEMGLSNPYEMVIPPGSLGPMQTEPWRVGGSPICWGCATAMPDEVVYEFTRIMAANAARFTEVHISGKGINPKWMPRVMPAEYIHPGAVKYYKEAGVASLIGKRW
jgi:TRAP-type uncharacterized transport system substrate-binding protein